MSVALEAPPALARLKELLGIVADVQHADAVAGWDSRVNMPPGGAAARADVAATVGRFAHELFVSDEVGELVDELRPFEESLDYESDDAALIRVTRRDWERYRVVPPELAAELAQASGLALAVWDEARPASDFAIFLPHLERQLELKRRYIDCFPPADHPFDVLLEDYEPGMTAARVDAIFSDVKDATLPLIENAPEVDDSFFAHEFPIEAQKDAGRRVLAAFGFDDQEWRLDETPHPFAAQPGVSDVRLTTNYRREDLHSLFSTMHEFGHGVYEWGVDPALARTPLGTGTSSAVHESQSRTWENLVGRSRAFWRFFYPTLQELFADALGDVDEAAFYRAINAIKPGPIRIDADEVTYNLHIILRFELEQELLDGRLAAKDVPDAWNARVRDYLGIDVADDGHGVLQDMHWAAGLFGYFPTYSLGNVLSVQIWERAREDLAELDEQLARGEFAPLREWLREHVYRHGRKFTPDELTRKITGGAIDPAPYIGYLRDKLTSL